MKILLTGFQDFMDVNDLSKSQKFLVFANELGQELKIPVGDDALQAVVAFLAGAPKRIPQDPRPAQIVHENVSSMPVDDEEEELLEKDADEFGGEDPADQMQFPEVPSPSSEDEIPSL